MLFILNEKKKTDAFMQSEETEEWLRNRLFYLQDTDRKNLKLGKQLGLDNFCMVQGQI